MIDTLKYSPSILCLFYTYKNCRILYISTDPNQHLMLLIQLLQIQCIWYCIAFGFHLHFPANSEDSVFPYICWLSIGTLWLLGSYYLYIFICMVSFSISFIIVYIRNINSLSPIMCYKYFLQACWWLYLDISPF